MRNPFNKWGEFCSRIIFKEIIMDSTFYAPEDSQYNFLY